MHIILSCCSSSHRRHRRRRQKIVAKRGHNTLMSSSSSSLLLYATILQIFAHGLNAQLLTEKIPLGKSFKHFYISISRIALPFLFLFGGYSIFSSLVLDNSVHRHGYFYACACSLLHHLPLPPPVFVVLLRLFDSIPFPFCSYFIHLTVYPFAAVWCLSLWHFRLRLLQMFHVQRSYKILSFFVPTHIYM